MLCSHVPVLLSCCKRLLPLSTTQSLWLRSTASPCGALNWTCPVPKAPTVCTHVPSTPSESVVNENNLLLAVSAIHKFWPPPVRARPDEAPITPLPNSRIYPSAPYSCTQLLPLSAMAKTPLLRVIPEGALNFAGPEPMAPNWLT